MLRDTAHREETMPEDTIMQVGQLETVLLVAVVFTVATYLILQKSFVRILFGFVILTNGANLFLLAMSGNPDGKRSPVLTENSTLPAVDPVPQALVLTAIVIGFGLTIYMIMLLYRIFLDSGTTDTETLFTQKEDHE
jgi:multicomponent Na+:H+ antiporter subunit C